MLRTDTLIASVDAIQQHTLPAMARTNSWKIDFIDFS